MIFRDIDVYDLMLRVVEILINKFIKNKNMIILKNIILNKTKNIKNEKEINDTMNYIIKIFKNNTLYNISNNLREILLLKSFLLLVYIKLDYVLKNKEIEKKVKSKQIEKIEEIPYNQKRKTMELFKNFSSLLKVKC